MNARLAEQDRDDDVSEYCRHDEHGACYGNHDIKGGAGPAVPLHRCACSCHGGIRLARRA
ncbi:hypothetical protein [Streptomyces chartreusis]|uniref:hypothetical protein n=1 Tax=Streptomyces chartreusis TaxID=1969 RepID=UPI00123D14A4|nr:hypothetical protein [Streptomyces chartreusis]QEV66178.1 hypothetical protein CP983_05560 [Streptomyces chartreusis]GGW98454.1 hypothetical protein GCM10010321_10970 [Streptomyces chartreusis]